jgi:hypothetical protein
LTRKIPRSELTRLGLFLYLWLMVGMFLGTIVLLLPVRWVLAGMQRLGWEQRAQNVVLIAVILAYVGLSWFVTRALHRRMFATEKPAIRFGIPALATVLAVTTFWLWSNPSGLFASLAGGSSSHLSMGSGAVWEFGKYPDTETLRRLKRENITAVISLEHPGDLVERQAIEDERRITRELGLRLVEAPMLPWVSRNEASLEKIRSIARTGKGRYYVHCGLGRDRVNLVKHMLEGMGARTVAAQGYVEGNFFHTRIPNFERGQLATFGGDKWLAPYPDKHEMLANILQGKRAQIILALDTTDAEQRQWWQEARGLFKEYAIRYEDMSTKSGDQARIRQIVSRLLAVPGPAAVIVPFTPKKDGKPRPGSETSDQIVREFTSRTRRPIVWTTNSEYVPGQPTERGNTEMPPPIGG